MNSKKLFRGTELIVLGALLGLGAGCREAPAEEAPGEKNVAALSTPSVCMAHGMTEDDVCVCNGSNYGPPCMLLNANRRFYSNLTNLDGSGAFNDSIQSFVVGSNVRVKVCVDDTYRGACDTATGPAAENDLHLSYEFGTFQVPERKISSIYVDYKAEDCLHPGSFQVALFDAVDFIGRCTLISKPWTGDGLYPNASKNADANGQGGGFGWPHDTISSLIVGDGVRVQVYKESNYVGMQAFGPGARILRLAQYPGFDNIISSIKVLGL
jgi:hypothetical protein